MYEVVPTRCSCRCPDVGTPVTASHPFVGTGVGVFVGTGVAVGAGVLVGPGGVLGVGVLQ